MFRNTGHSMGRAGGVLAVLFALTGALSASTLTADCTNLPAGYAAHVFLTWLDDSGGIIGDTTPVLTCNTAPVVASMCSDQPVAATRFVLDTFVFSTPTGAAGSLLKDCHAVVRMHGGVAEGSKRCSIPGGSHARTSLTPPGACSP